VIVEVKQRWSVIGWELLRASEGTLSRRSWLYLQSLAPTNLHWSLVVGYGPYSLCVIHKEGLCLSSGDINRLMMMLMMKKHIVYNSQALSTDELKASKNFIKNAHVLLKLLSYEEYCSNMW
jgi:hypothetical protein